jgi:hypothetical protein
VHSYIRVHASARRLFGGQSRGLSLTQALRVDLRKRNVAVCVPGAVDTDMIRGLEMPKSSLDALADVK